MDFNDLLECMEAEALSNKLFATEASIYEYICRRYSQRFSTPLHLVMELDPAFVVRMHYEAELDEVDLEENLESVLDQAYALQDPNYERSKKDQFAEDIKKYEAQEAERIAKGLPVHKAMAKMPKKTSEKTLLKKEEPTLAGPTEGFVNFGHLKVDEEK